MEGFKKFHLLYQCWIVVTVHRLIARYQCLYTLQILFKRSFIHLNIFQTKNWETFREFRVFAFDVMSENENAESTGSSIKFSLSLPVIFTD